MSEQTTIKGFESTQSKLGLQATNCYAEEKKLQIQQAKCDSKNADLMGMMKAEGKKIIKIKSSDGKIVTLKYKKTHTRTKEKIEIKEVEDEG